MGLDMSEVRAFAGHLAEVTDSTDALLLGRILRLVQAAPCKEHATAYRVFVEEIAA